MNTKKTTRRVSALLVLAVLMMAAIPALALKDQGDAVQVASFTVNTSLGEPIHFTKEDFTSRVTGAAQLDGILITGLPDITVGQLQYGDRALLEGEAVAVESLGALKFVPTTVTASAATFEFLPVFSDGVGLDSVTVAVQVASTQNMAPTAEAIEAETYKDVAVEVKFRGTDPEGDQLTYTVVDKPSRGEITLNESGDGFLYTPFHNKTGKDTFSYTAADSAGNVSDPAQIIINIEKSPVKQTYADMEDNGAHYASLRLMDKGVFVGEMIGDEYFFRPDQTVSRGEFLAMAVQALGKEEVTPVLKTGFADDDVTPAWVKPYASSALKAGIIHGASGSDGSVNLLANNTLTRAEAAVILNNSLELQDVDATQTVFSEAAAPAWATQAVANLQSAGMLETVGSLNSSVTRAEAAQMICAALDEQEKSAQSEKKGWFFGLF